MFKTLATLINGQHARTEDRVRDAFAIELIDQKIRESENSLRAAKATLASLIQRQRSENKQHESLKVRVNDLTKRAKEALDNDREDMAAEAARAIANMENELTVRSETLNVWIRKSCAYAARLKAVTDGSSTSNKVPFKPVPCAANRIFRCR